MENERENMEDNRGQEIRVFLSSRPTTRSAAHDVSNALAPPSQRGQVGAYGNRAATCGMTANGPHEVYAHGGHMVCLLIRTANFADLWPR